MCCLQRPKVKIAPNAAEPALASIDSLGQGSLAVEAPALSDCEEIPAEEAAGPEAAASTAGCSEEAVQLPVLQKDQHSLPWQEERPATCPQLLTAARSAATAPRGTVADPQACYEAGTGGSKPGSTPAAESDTGAGPNAGRKGQSCLQLDSVSSHLAPLAPSESSDVELSDVDLSDVELEPVPGPTAAASASAVVAPANVKGRSASSDAEVSQRGTGQGPARAAAAAAAVASSRQGFPDEELSGMELEAEPGTAVLCLHWVGAPFPVLLRAELLWPGEHNAVRLQALLLTQPCLWPWQQVTGGRAPLMWSCQMWN